ncbi:interleukin-17 receptor A [Hoplias malabaricus]|uniref:interleukin-17 receptor A n=1 Tax=Hoplias malabaricus TaxID=27720 RepID=UPI0034618EB8
MVIFIYFLFIMLSFVSLQVSLLGFIEWPLVQCSQPGLACKFHIGRSECSDNGQVKPRQESPGLPVVELKTSTKTDKIKDIVPVLFLKFILPPDGSIHTLRETEVHVLEVATNSSLCVRYEFPENISQVFNQAEEQWSFTLDRIVVDPGLKYQVVVSNLPKPYVGKRSEIRNISVPGCEDVKFQHLKVCLENGSLWEPNITWSVSDSEGSGGVVKMMFNTGLFSELYRVTILHADLSADLSHTVLKDNHTSVSVDFPLNNEELQLCEFVFVIKPFFVRCMNSCSEYHQKAQIGPCPTSRQHMFWIVFALAGLIFCTFNFVQQNQHSNEDLDSSSHGATVKDEVNRNSTQRPSNILIIYSLDHPLYKEIVLKLCAFLRVMCGTEVTLDLLDFTWLSTVGRIQWLDIQRERLARGLDKVLILCSPGVNAKWRGMCGEKRVVTREDIRSPVGDMLTPALSLMVPDVVYASSLQKYIVAYFADVCSENDIPAPFKVAVKYQLMKHFEELFFRLMDKEKHEPGSIKEVHGIGEYDYFNSSPGKALKEAIEAFKAHQLANPNWFEMELVDANYAEIEESGAELEEGLENDHNCALQHMLWPIEISAPVLINNLTGQTNKEPLPENTQYTFSDFSLNEIYFTMPLTDSAPS